MEGGAQYDEMDGLPPVSTRPRWLIGVGAAAVLFVVTVIVACAVLVLSPRGETERIPAAQGDPTSLEAPLASTLTIFVHVSGSVENAGLYELAEGSRVVDAIAAAGGFASDAVRDGVNLARVLKDGEHLRVPSVDDPVSPTGAAGAQGGGTGQVNINRATGAQLEELSGIGPATATAIIEWREQNGPFRTVDDLLEVSGIGPKTLEGMRDEVTV